MILFVCSQAYHRSRTAEVLATMGGAVDVRSAGTDKTALVALNIELVKEAEVIFCMDQTHAKIIKRRYNKEIMGLSDRLIILNIEDRYDRFNTDLVMSLFNKLSVSHHQLATQIMVGASRLYALHPALKKSSLDKS